MIHDESHSNIVRSEGAPLGIYTKSYSADINETLKARSFRARRFALKSVVNDILPESRTSKCHRVRAPKQQVEVWRGVSAGVAGKAFYKGLYVCGSLWNCPVCAAKISERRRLELSSALDSARSQGLNVMLLTQTIPHGLGDSLLSSLSGLSSAEKLLWSSRSGSVIREKLGIVGTIKTTEVTYGSNGWHPHKHTLLFISSDFSPSQVQNFLSPLWIASCVKKGLPAPSLAHGLTVQDGSFADGYVSKWGLESEMTKGHSKVAKQGGLTPFALLQSVLDSGELFKEYAHSFKGKRQLVWSKHLRDLLLPDAQEQSDEVLAASESEDVSAVFWATLSIHEWRAVRFFKYESTLLDKSEDTISPESFQSWLNSVTDAYRFAKNE
jgi:hypothetical protein